MNPSSKDFLRIGPHIRVLPIIHGAGDFAVRVREEILNRKYDCLAVLLPPSFKEEVEGAIRELPTIAAVVQRDGDGDGCSYVPIDPCQGVIAGLRDGGANPASVHRPRNGPLRSWTAPATKRRAWSGGAGRTG